MARIFIGNRSMVDEEVLQAVKTLSDEFWVFAEFDINRRNVDWLVVRQVPDDRPAGRFSTVILTELKRTKAILDGDDNSRWREYRDGDWQDLEPSNMRDINPWRQLINTVNTFRDWLYNNQRRFVSPSSGVVYPESSVKIWPNLLILSDPPDTVHRLPLKPHNGYGAYHFNLAEWVRRVWGWTPREGLQLTAHELADLARVLGLSELPQEPVVAPGLNGPETVEPSIDPALLGSLEWLEGFSVWATGIEQRIRALEEQMARLSQPALTTQASARPPSRPQAFPLPSANTDRPLNDDERQLIVTALQSLRDTGKTRDFPCLFAEMHRIGGGPTFKARNFNGYGSALSMMSRAVFEGLIQFGPVDANGVPTVYLPDETVPDAPSEPAGMVTEASAGDL